MVGMNLKYIKNKYKLKLSITSKKSGKDNSSIRAEIVDYALKFKGNPYVRGEQLNHHLYITN